MTFSKARARWRAIPKGDKKALFYFVILPLFVFVLWAVGYVWNIVKLFDIPVFLSGAAMGRLAGVFLPPLGGIMGWF